MALLKRQDEVVEARHACTCVTFALAWAPHGSNTCSQAAETAAIHSGCLVSIVNSLHGGAGDARLRPRGFRSLPPAAKLSRTGMCMGEAWV